MSSSQVGNQSGLVVSLPHRIKVIAVRSSRYQETGTEGRPQSWDMRTGGIDVVEIEGGHTIRLCSSPMQSVPKQGWILMLTAGDPSSGYQWTLYGMSSVNINYLSS